VLEPSPAGLSREQHIARSSLKSRLALVGNYDFAVNEQCYQYKECAALNPFISAGKAVLQIEYKGNPTQICPISLSSGFSTLFKNLNLDGWRQAC